MSLHYGHVGVPPADAVPVAHAAAVAVASVVDEDVKVAVGVAAVAVGVNVEVDGVSDPATLVRNWFVTASAVWVAATALPTAFGVAEGVLVNVGDAAVVPVKVAVGVFVIVGVFVNVDVGVKVGDGVNVLVGGMN